MTQAGLRSIANVLGILFRIIVTLCECKENNIPVATVSLTSIIVLHVLASVYAMFLAM